MRSLSQREAADRAAAITVESYDIRLDVTTDEFFRSITTVRFAAARRGTSTFAELKPVRLHAATLNGEALDVGALEGNRLPLTDLREENVLTVEADMAYSRTAEGLHRFVDPADGNVYLHATSFLDEAQRIFACFDQPDLKAPVAMRVTAPTGWTVAANGALASSTVDGAVSTWEFAVTQPLATYFVSLIAGPYHVVQSEHDGVPMAIFCRASLAEHLDKDADEIFEVTRGCLDRFHELFGIRYPFGKYDQAFVPEFNAGAMENPGLVVIRDDYVFRSAVTESERELRATTIAHEMAHMWFGDLVTMRWWDDLWLNESFAEYMGSRVTAEATRFRDAWTTFGMRRKAWGYDADQRPSTHPVAPTDVPDAAAALVNFDGISYAKGASVLRQLVAWVGDEAFLAGIRAHFEAHAFGNATLADLLDALSAASGRDLTSWADLWLRQAGVNSLRAATPVRDDGTYGDVSVTQSSTPRRPHRVGIGLYDRGEDGVTTLRRRIEVDVDGAVTGVAALRGERAADLLLLNDGDLTFAKVRLDDASAAAVPLLLPSLRDPLARAVVWTSTIDAVRDAERPVSDLVDLMVAALPAETEVIVVEDVLLLGRRLIDRYLPADERAAALARVAAVCDVLVSADGGDSRRLAAMRGLVGATADVARLRGWLDGAGVPSGITVDEDLRWRIVYRLAVLGGIDADELAGELAADRSAAGEEWAARARAARPDPAAKAAAWESLTGGDPGLSNRLLEASARGMFQPEQVELTAPYVARYFAEMPEAARRLTPFIAEQVADQAFPRYAVEERTRELAAAMLARDDIPPGLRRAVIDNDDDLRLALAARAR